MSEDSQIPVLLLSQENTMYLYHVRIFQYIPDIASTVQMNGVLEEGASGGFYRASLALEGDGTGSCSRPSPAERAIHKLSGSQ